MNKPVKSINKKRFLFVLLFTTMSILTVVACWVFQKYCGLNSSYHSFAVLLCIGFFIGFLLMSIISQNVSLFLLLSFFPLITLIVGDKLYTDKGFSNVFPFMSSADPAIKFLFFIAIIAIIYFLTYFFSCLRFRSYDHLHKNTLSEEMNRINEKLRELKLSKIKRENQALKEENAQLKIKNKAVQKTTAQSPEEKKERHTPIGLKIVIAIILGLSVLAWFAFSMYFSVKNSISISGAEITLDTFYETLSLLAIPLAILLLTIVTIYNFFVKRQGEEISILSKTAPWILVLFFVSMIVDRLRGSKTPLAWIKELLADGGYVVPSLIIMVVIVLAFITAGLISHIIKVFTPKVNDKFKEQADSIADSAVKNSLTIVDSIIRIILKTMQGALDVILFIPSFLGSLKPLILDDSEEKPCEPQGNNKGTKPEYSQSKETQGNQPSN